MSKTLTAKSATSKPDESSSRVSASTSSGSSERVEHEDYRLPWFTLFLNGTSSLIYLYAIYYQNFNCEYPQRKLKYNKNWIDSNLDHSMLQSKAQASLFQKIMDPKFQRYGLWIFLTYHSLLIQFVSCFMHVICHFLPRYNICRDLIFSCLSYPIGSLVVYTFWTVWLTQGREMIFPKYIESFYPSWLNHVTHTICVPINIAQSYLIYHRVIKKGCYLALSYVSLYGIFIMFTRWSTGLFIYPFLNEMSAVSVFLFFGTNLFCTFALYETGFFMTGVFHSKRFRRRLEE